MTRIRDTLVIWGALCGGMILCGTLLLGQWPLVIGLGLAIGCVTPFLLSRPTEVPTNDVGEVVGSDRLLRQVGGGLALLGVLLLLWLFIGNFIAALHDLHPALASAVVFSVSFMTGCGMNMAVTGFNFMLRRKL